MQTVKNIINHNIFIRFIYFILALFFVSLTFNILFFPNNLIVGGISGLAVIMKSIIGINPSTFVTLCNLSLIIIAFIFLTKKEAFREVLGCIFFSVMLNITEPLAQLVTLNIDSLLLIAFIGSLTYGLGAGIIYRAGFSTGGADIIIAILSKYLKLSITKISLIVYITIIVFGLIVFDPVTVMYSVFIIYISNIFTNFALYSVSTKKLVYVVSKKNREIEHYILEELHTGSTELKIKDGKLLSNKQMLMCVIHSLQYEKFKYFIKKTDPKAFMFANRCYEVNGGMKNNILPF